MLIKYRIYELARDLGVSNKDIIFLVEKYFNVSKKHMTSLNEEELNMLFEHFTQNNQVENLNKYEIERMNKSQKMVSNIIKKKNDLETTKIADIDKANSGVGKNNKLTIIIGLQVLQLLNKIIMGKL